MGGEKYDILAKQNYNISDYINKDWKIIRE